MGRIPQAIFLQKRVAAAHALVRPVGHSQDSEKHGHVAHMPVTLKVPLVSVVSDQVQTHKPYMVTFDLTDSGSIVAATAEILRCFGCVDVLINNAGVSYRGAIVDTTMEVDKKVMETNYFGPVALTKGNSLGLKGKRKLVCWHSLVPF